MTVLAFHACFINDIISKIYFKEDYFVEILVISKVLAQSKMLKMISMNVFTFFVVAGLFAMAEGQVRIGQCTKNDTCSCIYDDGTIVSLRPLENKNGKPRFSNVSDSAHDLYSWNPCSGFTYAANNSECVDVSVCMIRQGLPFTLFYDLGNQNSADFHVDENGTLKLTYTADKGDFKRITEITLQCQPQSSIFDFFVAQGEQEIKNDTIKYKLSLASNHACPFAPSVTPAKEEKESGLSGLTIFIIVLFSLIGSYVVFGVMFQAFVKKESGKKLCPNHEFWCSLPALLLGGCKKKSSLFMSSEKGGAKYDSI